MQAAHRFLIALGMAAVSAASSASTTVYTSSASFLAQVAPGAYTELFTDLENPPVGPAPFSGGGFSYTASAGGDIYLGADALSTSLPNEALTINFTSGNVSAIGANFYAVNFSDEFQSLAMTLTLSDGTTVNFTPTSLGDSYRGFVSTSAITSLTIAGPGVSMYASLDNFTVGSAVPEPGTWALMALGVAGLLAARRRQAA